MVDLTRQAEMVDEDKVSRITMLVVGAGNIGSHAAAIAASMGVSSITLVDPDAVAEENLAPGGFAARFLEKPKVEAVARLVEEKLGLEEGTGPILPVQAFFEEAELSRFYDVVLVCPDNMEARRAVWDSGIGFALFIDARMGGPYGEAYSYLDGDDPSFYEDMLDLETNELPCGQKATAPICAGILPGAIGCIIMQFLNGEQPWQQVQLDLGSGQWLLSAKAQKDLTQENEIPEEVEYDDPKHVQGWPG